jgi:hypothetical protein
MKRIWNKMKILQNWLEDEFLFIPIITVFIIVLCSDMFLYARKRGKAVEQSVPDRRRRIHLEVVSVRRGNLGFWEFGGGRVRGRVRKGRSVYKQPATEVEGSCHS